MSATLPSWPNWEEPQSRPRRFAVSLGHLDRAEAAATEGDCEAAAHFFQLAEMEIADAVWTTEMVNATPSLSGAERLLDLARRFGDQPDPAEGYGIEFRLLDDDDVVSVWLTLGRLGSNTGALLPHARNTRSRAP